MSDVVLLGANRSHVATIRTLRANGHTVWVVDDAPIPLAARAADHGYRIDPTSSGSVVARLRDSGCLPTVVLHMSEALSQAALDIARGLGARSFGRPDLVDKQRQRMIANESAEQRVDVACCTTPAELLRAIRSAKSAVIVKPAVSRGGSRGVSLVTEIATVDTAALWEEVTRHYLGDHPLVLVEPALDGPQLSVDGWVDDDRAHIWGIGLNTKQAGRHRVNTAITYFPSLWDQHHQQVREAIEDLSRLYGVASSPVHVEFADTTAGLKLIEFAVRTGGGAVPDAIAAAGGIHPVAAAVDMVEKSFIAQPAPPSGFSALQFVTAPAGTCTAIVGVERARRVPGCVDAFAMPPLSNIIDELSATSDRLGFLIVAGNSADQASDRLAEALGEISIEFDDGDTFTPGNSTCWQSEEVLDIPM